MSPEKFEKWLTLNSPPKVVTVGDLIELLQLCSPTAEVRAIPVDKRNRERRIEIDYVTEIDGVVGLVFPV